MTRMPGPQAGAQPATDGSRILPAQHPTQHLQDLAHHPMRLTARIHLPSLNAETFHFPPTHAPTPPTRPPALIARKTRDHPAIRHPKEPPVEDTTLPATRHRNSRHIDPSKALRAPP